MQTEPVVTELGSNGQSVASTLTKNREAGAAPSGIAQEFRDFVADMEDLVEASTGLTGDDLARAKANLYARVAAARASIEGMPATISARARKTAKVADGYVREQPWQAIGISAVVGGLIGFLLGRRGE